MLADRGPVSSLVGVDVGEGPIRQRSNPAFYRPGGACWTGAARGGRGRARVALKVTAHRRYRRRRGPVYLYDRAGRRRGSARGRVPAPRPHAPAAVRQGQATAEDEPRRRPRAAAFHVSVSAESPERARKDTTDAPTHNGLLATRHRMMVDATPVATANTNSEPTFDMT